MIFRPRKKLQHSLAMTSLKLDNPYHQYAKNLKSRYAIAIYGCKICELSLDNIAVITMINNNLLCSGEKLMTYCGSWKYSAPEILLQEEYDPPAVDVWSLGVMLFQMVAGRLPFSEVNQSETLTKVRLDWI